MKSIKLQIALMALLPLILLVGLAGVSVYREASELSTHRQLLPLTRLSFNAGALVHELQKERGMTVSWIKGNHDQRLFGTLAQQRDVTKGTLEGFARDVSALEIEDAYLSGEIRKVIESVEQVADLRRTADLKQVPASWAVANYTSKIDSLLRLIGLSIASAPSPTVTTELQPFMYLVQAKEAGGLERALGAGLLNEFALSGNVNSALYMGFIGKYGAEAAFMNGFYTVAAPDQLEIFRQQLQGPEVETVEAWRKVLQALPQTLDAKGIEGAAWFQAATKRLNLIQPAADQIVVRAEAAAKLKIDQYYTRIYTVLAVVGLFVVLCAAYVFWQLAAVGHLLKTQSRTISALAEGELDVIVPFQERADEIGDMARATAVFQANRVRQLDLETTTEANRQRELETARRMEQSVMAFEEAIGGLQGNLVSETLVIEEAASSLVDIAALADERGAAACAGSASASGSVQSVASAATELSASIREIARQSTNANDISTQTQAVAEQTTRDVAQLALSAGKIGEVVEMIRAIAEQTNLLALNATIEAARAGEAGRGFSVVAAEVKELSQQTARATDEISLQMSGIQASTQNAVDAIQMISAKISEVQNVTGAIAAAVEEQDAATSEISMSISQAADGSTEATENVESMTGTINETRQKSEDVNQSAERLGQLAQTLSSAVSGFLSDVRGGTDKAA